MLKYGHITEEILKEEEKKKVHVSLWKVRVRPGHEMNRFQWEKNEKHPDHGCCSEEENLSDVPGALGICGGEHLLGRT